MKKLIFAFTILSLLVLVFGSTPALAAPVEKVDVLIGFTQPPGQAEQALIRGLGGDVKYTYSIIPTIAATVPENAIAGLRNNPRVTHVNPDVEVHAIAEVIPWGVDRIDADVVQVGGNKGTGVKVAIIDTGIDKDHPDLQANIKGGTNFVARLPWLKPDATAWDDDNGHGSHVAGIVAAVGNNGIGYIGVAPEAYLYGVKVLDKNGSGYLSNVIAGIDWAVTYNMQVINMSLGSTTDVPDLKAACDAAYVSGIVVVAAAGNSGDDNDSTDNDVNYPARYESVIAVAATDSGDIRASWSSDGPEVELAAPGVSILSTYKDGGYAILSGTSMASPHVAGVAALVIKSGIVTNGNGLCGVADEVRAQMNSTADDLGASGWDRYYGNGLVDADEAAFTPAGPNNSPVANAGGPYTGTVGNSVTFDGSDSADPDNNPLTYAWSFGDGGTGTGVSPTHTYTAAGEYTITLVVNDGIVDSAPATTSASISPATTIGNMHVGSIDVTYTIKKAGKNTFYNGVAKVTVVGADGAPVQGVTVSGQWSGLTSDSDSEITDASGIVTLTSDSVKTKGTFTFTVYNLAKIGWNYDIGSDVETWDSITIQ